MGISRRPSFGSPNIRIGSGMIFALWCQLHPLIFLAIRPREFVSAWRKIGRVQLRTTTWSNFPKKIRSDGESYPQLWITPVLQKQHVLIHTIHRSINRWYACIAKIFFHQAIFLLTKLNRKITSCSSSHHLRYDNLLSLRRIFLSCSNSWARKWVKFAKIKIGNDRL